MLVATAAWVIYLLRGQGPTTKDVEGRLNPPVSAAPSSPQGPSLLRTAALVAGAMAVGAAENRAKEAAKAMEFTFLPVPSGLALRDRFTVKPVLAMRANGHGTVEVTFDGRYWEPPSVVGDWVTADGERHHW